MIFLKYRIHRQDLSSIKIIDLIIPRTSSIFTLILKALFYLEIFLLLPPSLSSIVNSFCSIVTSFSSNILSTTSSSTSLLPPEFSMHLARKFSNPSLSFWFLLFLTAENAAIWLEVKQCVDLCGNVVSGKGSYSVSHK